MKNQAQNQTGFNTRKKAYTMKKIDSYEMHKKNEWEETHKNIVATKDYDLIRASLFAGALLGHIKTSKVSTNSII